ncbi:MAG: hypothetical protein DRQ58_05940 [Gammaproteobacteria bacterium]|nr:MAG: hypothetical protein DRQ58_05940 [Gammaproteobacteria bacterium]
MNPNLEFGIKAVINTIAVLIVTVQVIALIFIVITGNIGAAGAQGFKMVYAFCYWSISALGMSAALPCLYFSIKYVLIPKNLKLKMFGITLALFIPAINWLLLLYNIEFANEFGYELEKVFSIKKEYWIFSVSVLIVIATQILLPLKATQFINKKLQYNQSLKHDAQQRAS